MYILGGGSCAPVSYAHAKVFGGASSVKGGWPRNVGALCRYLYKSLLMIEQKSCDFHC